MSEPHTSVFNVQWYVGPYVVAGKAGSVGHLYHTLLLLPCAPVVLPHAALILSPSLNKYVQQPRLGTKEPPHYIIYALLPRSTLTPQCHSFMVQPQLCTEFTAANIFSPATKSHLPHCIAILQCHGLSVYKGLAQYSIGLHV